MTKPVTEIIERTFTSFKPYPRNARTHSKKQIKQIAASIERFGFVNPVLIGDDGEIIAGHGRVEAARQLGMTTVPTLALSHLSKTERRAYVLADNKLALNAGWDREILAIELQGLFDLDFEVELTGFSLAEIDFALDEAGEANPDASDATEDAVPDITGPAVSRMGDVWVLARHKLICGDARSSEDYARLLGNERVDMVFTDPPYNVASETAGDQSPCRSKRSKKTSCMVVALIHIDSRRVWQGVTQIGANCRL